MADGILLFHRHLGESDVIALGTENGIVAESLATRTFGGDRTTADALKLLHLAIHQQYDDCSELCRAVSDAFQLAQQFVVVGLAVVVEAFVHRIACRTHSGIHTQGAYFEARIIGEAIHIVMHIHILGLLQGIACKGVRVLGDVFVAPDIAQRQNLIAFGDLRATGFEQSLHLVDLVGIVGSKNKFPLFHIIVHLISVSQMRCR